MNATFLSIAAIIFYFLTWVLIIRCVYASIKNPELKKNFSKLHTLTWLLALVTHIAGLHYPLFIGEPLTLSFISLGSYVTWFLSLILFITTLNRKIESLAIPILPITMFSILAVMLFGADTQNTINMKSGLGLHILSSLLAYSTLMLASFQALLLAVQNNHLHARKNTNFIRSLPSLENMEHLLFRFIKIGVILLTIGLLTGFYFLENLFGSGIAHKTILSIVAWVVFSILLFGRWKYGWRGKTAVRWTLGGFIVLMLAFFGTKFVQEFVLDDSSQVKTNTLIHTIG
ncbi:MAG: cytochrome c biogenesis protein CcsA [Cocleimonas sp.]|nr:cytochrome c biogenesis protein CcsA [Cocleimonas sp.]